MFTKGKKNTTMHLMSGRLCLPCTRVPTRGKNELKSENDQVMVMEKGQMEREIRALIVGLKDGIELCLETLEASRSVIDTKHRSDLVEDEADDDDQTEAVVSQDTSRVG